MLSDYTITIIDFLNPQYDAQIHNRDAFYSFFFIL